MATFWRNHWLTAAALGLAAFTLVLAVGIALDTDDTASGRTTGGVVFGICTLALLVGLWLLRADRATPVAYTLIVVAALVGGVTVFWLIIPLILAFLIIFFGVIRGGLVRELRSSVRAAASGPAPGSIGEPLSRAVGFTTEGAADVGVVKRHWITALSVLAAVFLVFLSVASFSASDPDYEVEDRIFGGGGPSPGSRVVVALGALALLGGLWGLRTGRLKLWVAHTLIILGAVVTASFFWLVIPTIVGITMVYAGVIKGGLERELRPG